MLSQYRRARIQWLFKQTLIQLLILLDRFLPPIHLLEAVILAVTHEDLRKLKLLDELALAPSYSQIRQ